MTPNATPSSPIPRLAAWVLARGIDGLPMPDLNGTLPREWEEIADEVARADQTQRASILQAELARRSMDVDAVLRAIAAVKTDTPPPGAARQTAYTADQLLDAKFPEPRPVIPRILVEGLNFLGGRPKIGKSWWALEAAEAVGAGGRFMDQDVKAGRVIYFALEDSPRRLQGRMRAINWPRGLPVTFCHDRALLGEGLAGIAALIEAEAPALLVVDTFSRAIRQIDQRKTQDMTDLLAGPQQAAVNGGCGLLLLDHHRKPKGPGGDEADHVDELMESTAKGAVADAVLGLFRKRGERTATLKVSGRDLEDLELAIEMARDTCCWQVVGDAAEVRQTARQRKVLAALRSLPAQTASTEEVANAASLPASHASKILQELIEAGKVRRLPRLGRTQPYQLMDIE